MAALSALGYFSDGRIGDAILNRLSALSPQSRARAIELLCSRPNWALKLLESIDRHAIPAAAVSRDLAQRLRQYDDPRLVTLIEKTWGKVRPLTPFETQGRVTAVLQLLAKQPGDAARGQPISKRRVRPATSCMDRERRSVRTSPVPMQEPRIAGAKYRRPERGHSPGIHDAHRHDQGRTGAHWTFG